VRRTVTTPADGPADAPFNVRMVWSKVYDLACDLWLPINLYEKEDARLTADVAVDGLFDRRKGWAPRNLRPVARMPDPGNLFECGWFTELATCNIRGDILLHKFAASDRIPLLWSESLQACFVFPYLERSPCNLPPTKREDQVARRWARGRPAKCARRAELPAPPMPSVSPALAIGYASDKFSHRGKKKGPLEYYLHHHEKGVRAYFAPSPTGSGPPEAIMVRGGRLHLATHGLAG
jgi:hypothetical protein